MGPQSSRRFKRFFPGDYIPILCGVADPLMPGPAGILLPLFFRESPMSRTPDSPETRKFCSLWVLDWLRGNSTWNPFCGPIDRGESSELIVPAAAWGGGHVWTFWTLARCLGTRISSSSCAQLGFFAKHGVPLFRGAPFWGSFKRRETHPTEVFIF